MPTDWILYGDAVKCEPLPSVCKARFAFRNLTSYQFWWATVSVERQIRRAFESALIVEARTRGEPLQNDRVSRGESRSARIHITSSFPSGRTISGIEASIDYGALDTDV